MTKIQAIQTSISKLLIHPLLWRLTGFVSSIVGFSCYALSPSFHNMFGHWNALKIFVYTVVSSLLSIFMFFIKRCSWGHGRSFLLKAQVGFVVLTLTSLWSVFEDRSEEGKVENAHGKMMNLTSSGAFALMAMSLSRQLQLGFEVGVFNFLVGCFLVTVMKMSFKLAPVAALFCYLLVNIRSISDFILEMHARGATQEADGSNTGTVYIRRRSSEDGFDYYGYDTEEIEDRMTDAMFESLNYDTDYYDV
ncbi:hypothetical protein AAZX31_01G023900 [Glycine max]|uniref:Transmembrane protein n=1 Tax=Glycine max TaxID=3847 RepID=K7K1E6_SOYBN|nr:uncharacterized protein LOC102668650 [Glycine max]KAG5059210.1 hypothetical protein JHK87_000239 [Glycine soja]KAG5067858.1 hypothetical protein JHK85_000235 [Glycine max]KAG5087621.1 hypothetical protein JHK86_000233 [Glycine max]KAH1161288.1 hypothetical protein GYH30_000255 [Glycine max]KRH74508.1 hypothetical protein GLYMA_01G024500v4 [Glycine max]|eukprot:XP_014633174.1 uncharacterized protein LOC102668650 [Glycine max]